MRPRPTGSGTIVMLADSRHAESKASRETDIGRPLPSFGLRQLQDLVNEALRSSAPTHD